MYITERLAKWATNVASEHTSAARLAAMHAIQDVVGCMIAGAGDEGAAKVREAVDGLGNGRSVIAGRLAQTSSSYAALTNGTAAHALDFDDTFLESITHASAVLMPALFALGDEINASGADIIDAYIVGLEFHGALGKALNRSHYDQGWHATSTLGVIGTAGACARLMKLDETRFAHVLNLAVSSCAGTKVQFGSMAKPLHAGLAAKNAIESAKLGAAGVEGHVNAFEGPMGLMQMYGGPSAPGWEAAFKVLGGTLAIERQGLTVKRFPCCAATHRALDCVISLMEKHDFVADDVASVDVQVRAGHIQNLRYNNPNNEFEARFSMQYCIAVALRYGTVRLFDFTPAAVGRANIRVLFPQIVMRQHDLEDGDGEDSLIPSIVNITLNDGRIISARQELPRGDAGNPLNDSERDAKFMDCCQGFLADADIALLSRSIQNIDNLVSIRELTRLLRFEAGCDHGERFERRA